jgi:sec-independent protein translocase protein TatA
MNPYQGLKLQETCMFGLGWPEVGVIAIVAILIFGPKKIPELGSALGKTLRGFKEEMRNPSQEPEDSEQDQANSAGKGEV